MEVRISPRTITTRTTAMHDQDLIPPRPAPETLLQKIKRQIANGLFFVGFWVVMLIVWFLLAMGGADTIYNLW